MKENNTYYDNMESNNLPDSLRVNPFIVPDNYFNEQTNRLLFFAKLDRTSKDQRAGFTVPEGYFEQLSEQTLAQAKIDQLHAESGLAVPADYFTDLSDRILAQVQIDQLQEEQFTVPQGYFEDLSQNIMAKVEEEKLRNLVQEPGFSVPEGYFETATDDIFASIAVADLKEQVQTDGFAVPTGYFEGLSTSILDQVHDKKVISMPSAQPQATEGKKVKRIAWIGAAAAACVAAFVGVYTVTNNPEQGLSAQATAHAVSLDDIPEEEILNYLSSYSDGSDLGYYAEYIYEPVDSDGIGSQIDDKELEEYLNYTL